LHLLAEDMEHNASLTHVWLDAHRYCIGIDSNHVE
jgi:hypothetical protein